MANSIKEANVESPAGLDSQLNLQTSPVQFLAEEPDGPVNRLAKMPEMAPDIEQEGLFDNSPVRQEIVKRMGEIESDERSDVLMGFYLGLKFFTEACTPGCARSLCELHRALQDGEIDADEFDAEIENCFKGVEGIDLKINHSFLTGFVGAVSVGWKELESDVQEYAEKAVMETELAPAT